MTTIPDSPRLRSVHRQMRFATLRVVVALILREMTTSNGRKPGGYLWTIIEPVAGVALMTWLFMAIGARTPGLGSNFAIFYATGLMPYFTYIHISNRTAQALTYSRNLLSYPRVTVVDALIARFVVQLITQLLVAYVLLGGIRLLMDTGTQLVLSHIVLGFTMAAALAAGIGTLNCFLSTMFPLWGSIWGVMMRPMLFLSGIMLLIDRLPVQWQAWLVWNPIVHIIAEVRTGFYHGYQPAYVSPAYVFGVALATGAVGLLFLWRHHRDILEN
ncbi:ABC transporter permease [Rubellimicrobium aerolatum]|uniref:Transport permease protein n=1 Tax=Rubellimicrobium aerolatum TaxID=490979 RepID=A0ABW0S9G9_9RHOB|nr:ABC transporter permease [Rubellimicrobium aerolatum]MBP1804886.1 capsular polysaccharide transport system permease protein [Rubellimicrobium aerolatum]